MDLQLRGKRIFVTGGSGGIGAAVARRFAEEGAEVAIGCRRQTSLAAFQQMHSDLSVNGIVGDLKSRSQCVGVVAEAVEVLGGLDVLVNAAGQFEEIPFEHVSQQDWDRCLDTNVAGTFFTLQAALPYLEGSEDGNAVNLGSDAGLIGYPASSAYSSAKAAIVNLTRALALELAGRVRVNCVCPGNVDTDMIQRAARAGPDFDGYLTMARARAPLGRMALAEEIADAILYLASPRAAFTHGALLSVDGGGVCGY